MPLNDRACRNAKPRSTSYRLSDSLGLYLEVMPNESKYWRFKYRFGGKEKRLAFGVYSTVSFAESIQKLVLAAASDFENDRIDRVKWGIDENEAEDDEEPFEEEEGVIKAFVFVRRYPHGKCTVSTNAPPEHEEIVKTALAKATDICVQFDDKRFLENLMEAGLGRTEVESYVADVSVIDNTFLRDRAEY